MGIIVAIISGALMSIQGVFNTNVTKKIGLWETTIIVQGISLVSTFIVYLLLKKGDWSQFGGVNKLYLTGGIIGTFITATVVIGMQKLGPTCAVSIILISQLLCAAVIDYFGLFSAEKLSFGANKFIGIAMLIAGVIIFKWKVK